jgi:YVTN family beta-propeller protein
MKSQFFKVISAVLVVGMLGSCREKVPDPEMYELGVIVRNAGNYFDNNGSISFLKRESATAEIDLFMKENGRSLIGNVQGYTEVGGHSLILLDNSSPGLDKVEIVNMGTFKSEATLAAPDIENPRDVIGINASKAYVTCWDATGDFSNFYKNPGYVAVIDLDNFKVVKKIPLPKGAEHMVKVGNEVYVGALGGTENLTVIDASTDAVKRSIKLGVYPDPIAIDANGKLWVKGNGVVYRVNPKMDAVEASLRVGTNPLKSPSHYAITPDRQGFYFVYSFYDPTDNYKQKGETYYFNINDTMIAADKPVINRVFTGLGVDPLQGLIYAGVTPSYKQSGYVLRYRTDGSVVDSIRVDVAPSDFIFK